MQLDVLVVKNIVAHFQIFVFHGSFFQPKCKAVILTIEEVFLPSHWPMIRLTGYRKQPESQVFTVQKAVLKRLCSESVSLRMEGRSLHPVLLESLKGMAFSPLRLGESSSACKHIRYIRPSHGWLDAPWVARRGQYCTGDWTHRIG